MTRAAASSADEIASRHAVVARGDDSARLPNVAEYEAVLWEPGGERPVGPCLAEGLLHVRSAHELEEIYVRPVGCPSFEPLENRHLALVGTVRVIARRRHPHADPRIVGIMLAKDESDVIVDVVASLRPALDRLYFDAGDGATDQAIVDAGGDWARSATTGALAAREGVACDGRRAALLEQARADALAEGDRRPLWVMVVQGDEIYHDDLRHHVRLAQRERATVMACQVATFVLHESQDGKYENIFDGSMTDPLTGQEVVRVVGQRYVDGRYAVDWKAPLERRLTHYVWDFGEHAGFLDYPWVHYAPTEHMRAHPHGLYPARYASARPVRKHYPFRSPEQAKARIEDRIKSGWQPHYENYRSVFMGTEAAGRPVKRYHGWFPEAERVEGIW